MQIYIRESYLSAIRPFIDTEQVKVITGMRRSGKSTIMRMLMDEMAASGRSREDMFFLDLESLEGRRFASETELCEHIGEWAGRRDGRVYVFLDEIQNLDGWERCIRSLLTDIDADIYLTGSSSKMLSGELATHLAGRYVEFRIRPFSFREVVDIERMRGGSRSTEELFQLYVTAGGMPLVVCSGYDDELIGSMISAMYDSIVVKDISERSGIRKTQALRDILSYVMSEIGHSMSSVNICNYLKGQHRSANSETVLEYLSAAEGAMFLSRVQRQDLRGREVLKTDYKFYLTDLGFRESAGFSNTSAIDQSLENIVYNELVTRGYRVTVGRGRGSEVDFVADRGRTREYYQVTYLMATEETADREFGALEDVRDSYPKFVLSMDRFDMSRNGIVHRNLLEWLLERPRAGGFRSDRRRPSPFRTGFRIPAAPGRAPS